MNIKIPDCFRCPNCLENHIVNDKIHQLFHVLYLNDNAYLHPFICNFCGGGFLIDENNMSTSIPEEPIDVDEFTIEELRKIFIAVRKIKAWTIKQPWLN